MAIFFRLRTRVDAGLFVNRATHNRRMVECCRTEAAECKWALAVSPVHHATSTKYVHAHRRDDRIVLSGEDRYPERGGDEVGNALPDNEGDLARCRRPRAAVCAQTATLILSSAPTQPH